MSDALSKRCTVALLMSLTMAAIMGLVVWGPVPLEPHAHSYADARSWPGLHNAFNVLVNLPLLAIGAWGWSATRMSRWPVHLRRPWQGFHLCVMLAAAMAATYHATPSDTLFVLSHMAMASAMMLLSCGLLAERLDHRIGEAVACAAVCLLVVAVGASLLLGAGLSGAVVDLRGLMLLEVIPVLMIPAGALGLHGPHTRRSDWMAMLSIYGMSKVLDVADVAIFDITRWISGHTLMHVTLGIVAGWLAYRASTATGPASSATSQRQTSPNTSA